MRKRQSFLLTIITPETDNASLCGRLKVISSGKTRNFTSLDELTSLIASSVHEAKPGESNTAYPILHLADDCDDPIIEPDEDAD